MTEAVRVADLRCWYRGSAAPAVDGVSFGVAVGEAVGLLGPSGAGKTTIQRAVLGLLSGWTGEIDVFGRSTRAWGPQLYERVGVSFELPVGYPKLTGREDLAHFAALHRRSCRDPGELLAAVGLAAAADGPLGTYSKGMRVRLNLARALLHEPELLVLDEPTAGLDPANAADVRALIAAEHQRGTTVVINTHDMRTADAVCDRVGVIVEGRLVALGDPRGLRLADSARLVRIEHRVDGRLQTESVALDEAPARLAALAASGEVETVHTSEPSLDEVVARLLGRP